MRVRTCAVAASGMALLAAGLVACGSGGGSSPSSGGGGAASSGGGSSNSSPYVIGDMTNLSGPASLPGGTDPITLAVKQINAAGGIDGRQVVLKSYDVGLDANTALTATRLAISQGVNALIGYPIDAGLTASIGLIEQANIPVIDFGEGPTTSQGALKTNLAWSVTVQSDEEASIAAQYLKNVLHATSVGLSNSEDANPVEGNQYIEQFAKKLGIASFTNEQFPETTTDLTAQVLNVKNVSAIFEWAYPQNDALFVRQLYQNGEGSIPVMLSTGGAFQWETKGIPAAQTAHMAYVSNCGTLYKPGYAPAAKFTSDLKAAYPQITWPETFAPNSYDAPFILKAAIEGGKSFGTSSIVAQLKTLTYSGVCGTYHANADGSMLNQLEVVSLANYRPKVLATYSNLASTYSALGK
jgi:ABC-type branched-subunit amino acid transport system substrate-binding protein